MLCYLRKLMIGPDTGGVVTNRLRPLHLSSPWISLTHRSSAFWKNSQRMISRIFASTLPSPMPYLWTHCGACRRRDLLRTWRNQGNPERQRLGARRSSNSGSCQVWRNCRKMRTLMFDTSRRQRLVAARRLCRPRRRLFNPWKVEEQLHGGWTALAGHLAA